MNVELQPNFKQVCVWPGTLVGDKDVQAFTEFFARNFKTRVQFLETIYTAPDIEDGRPVKGTGGRADAFFAVHNDDIGKFAVPRFSLGVRWIEDVLDNENFHYRVSLYPVRVGDYRCW